MDHNFQVIYIMISEGLIPVNDQWIRIDLLVIKNKNVWIICLLDIFHIAVLI